MEAVIISLGLLAVWQNCSCNIITSESNCVEECLDKFGKNPVCDEGGYQFDNLCVAQECSKVYKLLRLDLSCFT